MLSVLLITFPFFALVLCGYLAARRGLKGKGANMIHAHALGDKAKAPNGCTQQQTQTASNAFSPHFHHRRLL